MGTWSYPCRVCGRDIMDNMTSEAPKWMQRYIAVWPEEADTEYETGTYGGYGFGSDIEETNARLFHHNCWKMVDKPLTVEQVSTLPYPEESEYIQGTFWSGSDFYESIREFPDTPEQYVAQAAPWLSKWLVGGLRDAKDIARLELLNRFPEFALNWNKTGFLELLAMPLEREYYGVMDVGGLAAFMPAQLWFDPEYITIRGGSASFWLPWCIAGGRMGSEAPFPFKVTLLPTEVPSFADYRKAATFLSSQPTFAILYPFQFPGIQLRLKVLEYEEDYGQPPDEDELEDMSQQVLREFKTFLRDNRKELTQELEKQYGFDFV